MQREHLGAGHPDTGPTLPDVLPALVLTAVALALPLSLILLLLTDLAWAACMAIALFAVVLGLLALRLLRSRTARATAADRPAGGTGPAIQPPAHRPLTAEQIAALPDSDYRQVVADLLQRDGWQVREIPVGDDIHLVGSHRDGSRIGLRCLRGELSVQDGEDSVAPLRPVGAPPAGAPTGALWLMVSTGGWSRATVRWAARTNIRLVDGALLDRWCAGEDLADLLGLQADDLHAAQ
ncbi:restriction endonuclease [Kitasatospora aburaviensis]|uniref:Restriction endonuclease n=1 Tax=Kitasatospora aburaviensis TaxID=67265 RepID=A0ABW1F6H2_9ACTN